MKAMHAVAGVTLLLSCQSVAGAPDPAGEPEVGFLVGGALSLDGSNLEDVIEAPLTGANAEYDGPAVGAELNIGLTLGPYTQLRVGHRRFGDQQADVFNGDSLVGKAELSVSGNFFAADLMVPVNEEAALGVTLGMLEWDGELDMRSSGGTDRSRESGNDLFAGLRGQVLINKAIQATAFATRYDLETEDGEDLEYNVIGAGIQYRF